MAEKKIQPKAAGTEPVSRKSAAAGVEKTSLSKRTASKRTASKRTASKRTASKRTAKKH